MKLNFKTQGDREILFFRSFNAPRQMVWDAHTKPELIRRWLLGPDGWEMPDCTVDLRVGGKFRYAWRNTSDGRTMAMGGVYREIDAPAKMVHTEVFDEDWTGGETTVTTLFAEIDGRTEMEMTVVYASANARDGALKTGMTRGMEAGYERMEKMLAG